MPGLISSSSSAGPKAAPKAAARRRPGQAAASTAASGKAPLRPAAATNAPAPVAPPSPPAATQTADSHPSAQSGPEARPSLVLESSRANFASGNVPNDTSISSSAVEVIAGIDRDGTPSRITEPVPQSAVATGVAHSPDAAVGRATTNASTSESSEIPTQAPQTEGNAGDVQAGALPDTRSEITDANADSAAPAISKAGPSRLTKRARRQPDEATENPAAKKTKRSSTRSSSQIQSLAEGTSRDDGASNGQGVSTSQDIGTTGPRERGARGRRSGRGSKNSTADNTSTPDVETTAEASGETDTRAVRTSRKNGSKRRGANSPQDAGNQDGPEPDPELHEVDPKSLSMWDLSYDTTHGKVSDLGKKMAEIDWQEVARQRRLEGLGLPEKPEKADTSGAAVSVETQEVLVPTEVAESLSTQNPRDNGDIELQMDADGNIIANDDALVRVLNAEAEAAAHSGLPVIEENPITSRINRTSWINASRRDPAERVPMWKGKSDPWSEEETDRFYEALRMFGTDFFIISKMFEPKTRRMIKMKFRREEKLDPQRIDRALRGMESKPMDLEHYARETGQDLSAFTKYEGIEAADAAMREALKDTAAQVTATIEQEVADAEQKADQEKNRQREKGRRRGKNARKMLGGTMGGGPMDDDG